MSSIAGNGNAVMAAETGTVRGGDSALADLVMGDLDIQLLPSLQDRPKDTVNDRIMAYRDRILKAVSRSKGTV